ncbi:MAG: nucleotidyltransferase family protein [Acaryochloridaceae cyanobacterium SU_2_1]|nr:nucleotidyltransferase family protein [Acaryochloridaceae cyanobacterium SU_2_1]
MGKRKFHREFKTAAQPEVALLLACCSVQLDAKAIERIRTLAEQDINWQLLIETAKFHGVLTLLYQGIKLTNTGNLSASHWHQLNQYAHNTSVFNAFLASDLLKISKLLRDHQIRVLPFKGPVLAAAVYGSIGLRQFCDLDLLVNPQDFARAIDLLLAHGYQLAYEWNFLDQDFELALRNAKGEFQLTKGTIAIDLHQALTVETFLSSRFSFEYLWERREPMMLCGHALDGFGSDDLLMYLCIHGSKECWRKLKWICDINEAVLATPDRNWQQLLQQSAAMGCERMVLLGLSLAHQFLGTDLPEIVHQRLQSKPVCQNLAADLASRLFQSNNVLGRTFTGQKFIRHWQMTETLRDRITCFLDLGRPLHGLWIKCLPNAKDRDFLALPQPLYFLYYLIRPLRLGIKYLTHSKLASSECD